jgi:hypothetical protein
LKRLDLTQGLSCIVDDDDYAALSQYKWHAIYGSNGSYYAVRRVSGRDLYMHKVILGIGDGQQGDHINRDTLDNRRENLRPATHAQNIWNRDAQANNKLGIKGVSWVPSTHMYRVQIVRDYAYVHRGYYKTLEEAVEVAREIYSRLEKGTANSHDATATNDNDAA